jgi:AcrR family transcriptional regulator
MNDHSAMPAQAPTPAATDARSARDKRTAILDAALDLFSELTFDGTPVPLIAERAHVGAGTIYRYFDSKEALVNALYRRWKGEMARRLVESSPARAGARDEFAHWWRALWSFAVEHPKALAFLEHHHHAPYLDAESGAIGEAVLDGARAFVRRAQRSGDVVRGDADMLIALVMGAFRGLAKALQEDGHPAGTRVVRESEDRVWEMIRAK